jgi:hypothetical protein
MDRPDYDRDRADESRSAAETPTETAHKRGLVTGLVVGVIGGAIVGGLIVGMLETRQPQQPVATAPGTNPAVQPGTRQDRIWGAPDAEFGPGRVDRDERELRDEGSQHRLEGPGATPGTQPAPPREEGRPGRG